MIKIDAKFTKSDIKKMILERKQMIVDAITLRLQRVGETCVSEARQNGTYRDRTGNLRGSIGYIIMYNGKQINQNIEGTKEGERFAKKAIAEISAKYPTGFILIVVAGMVYASAVEAKGFDVITSSSIEAAIELKTSLQRLSEKLK